MSSFLRPPDYLDIEDIDINFFNVWLDAFNDYCDLCKPACADDVKMKLFLTVAGLSVRSLITSSTPQPTKYAELIDILKKHIQPIKSLVMERHKFFTAKQNVDESVTQYVVRLKQLATSCDFSNTSIDTITNQLLRDQFITGVNSKKITESLLESGDITLNDAIKKANGIEQAAKDMSELSLSVKASAFAITQKSDEENSKSKYALRNSNNVHNMTQLEVRCYNCHGLGHLSRDCKVKQQNRFTVCSHCKKPGHNFENCFLRATCNNCGIIGHTSNVCRNAKKMFSISKSNENLHYMEVTICGKSIMFLIDTGASLSLINRNVVEKNGWVPLLKTHGGRNAILASGEAFELTNFLDTSATVSNVSISARFFIGKISVDGILGMDLLNKLNVSIEICGEKLCSVLPDFLQDFADVFDKDLKSCILRNYDPFVIIDTPHEKPVRSPIRRYCKTEYDVLHHTVTDLFRAGVIEVSHSPWRSTPVIVDKSDGSKRVTINYKPLNAQTVFDAFPLPLIDNLIGKLNNARVFSKIDFTQFYHQIPLVDSDRPKTAFFADNQLWQYRRMPFGLKNAVAACSRIMQNIFKDIPNCVIYLDDILVYGSDKASHDAALLNVLNLIREHGLGLNRKKCSFNLNSIDFLGFFIENGTLKPSENRISALINFPFPGDLKSLERFMGMATYFCKFVPHYSSLAEPLLAMKLHLLRISGRKINPIIDFWSQEAKNSFSSIKSAIQNAVLVLPSPEERLILRTDASDNSVAAVLQTESGQPVSFLSRVLTKAEAKYDIVEKEALAVYWGIVRSKMFLLGREFSVISDHKPLQYLFASHNASPKLLRWRLALQEFTFNVVHCQGKENVVADCFSRITSIDFIPPTVNYEYIQTSQKFDLETQDIIRAITTESLQSRPDNVSLSLWSSRSSLYVTDGVLYNRNGKIFVPKRARIKVLTFCHGLHRGVQSTIACIKESFFWPSCGECAANFVKDCRICSLTRPQFLPTPNEPLITKAPMEILAMDYVGPLPESRGFRFLITIIDIYSKYAFVFPVRDMTAATLIQKCKEVFSFCGFPNCILSDRGTQFCSAEFLGFLRDFGVKKLTTNPYSPHSNGCCERFNGTLQKSIYAYLTDNSLSRSQWIRSLPAVLLNYRTSVHSTTKFRPVDIFFNFRVLNVLPDLKKSGTQINIETTKNLHLAARNGKNSSNSKIKTTVFPQLGQSVFVKSPVSVKFGAKGRVATVLEIINYHTVKVKYIDNQGIDTIAINKISPLGGGVTFQPAKNQARGRVTESQNAGVNDYVGEPLYNQPDVVHPNSRRRMSMRHHRPPSRYGIDDQPIVQLSQ